MSETGYVDGRNVAISYRFAENQQDRLPALAADLVARNVNVIAATGGGASVLAAKAATKTIPIVFTTGGDPVRESFVASLNRPGGNATGVSWFNTLLAGKGIGLLHEIVANPAMIALLADPRLPESARMQNEAEAAARTLGWQFLLLNASTPRPRRRCRNRASKERRLNARASVPPLLHPRPPAALRSKGLAAASLLIVASLTP